MPSTVFRRGAMAILILLAVGVATLSGQVANGGFESNGGVGTSVFTSWTVVDQPGGSGSWYVQTGTGSPLNAFPVPRADRGDVRGDDGPDGSGVAHPLSEHHDSGLRRDSDVRPFHPEPEWRVHSPESGDARLRQRRQSAREGGHHDDGVRGGRRRGGRALEPLHHEPGRSCDQRIHELVVLNGRVRRNDGAAPVRGGGQPVLLRHGHRSRPTDHRRSVRDRRKRRQPAPGQ